jgi:hypothetical protein
MLIQSETYAPMFKWWSAMSVGSGAADLRRVHLRLLRRRARGAGRDPLGGRWHGSTTSSGGRIGAIWALVGSLFASSSPATGVLLGDEPADLGGHDVPRSALSQLGGVYSLALLLLLSWRRRGIEDTSRAWLGRMDVWVTLLELLVLVLFVLSLGSVAEELLSGWAWRWSLASASWAF